MNEKKPQPNVDRDGEPITGQGTSPAERGLFECHPEDGEICEPVLHETPTPDPVHPKVEKVEANKDPERPKDERALFGCDADGKNCDA